MGSGRSVGDHDVDLGSWPSPVKQFIFVSLLTLIGTIGPFVITPFCGVFVYYLFAVLRPQFIWQWVLPADVQWSRSVGLATLGAALGVKLGLLSAGPDHNHDAGPKRGARTPILLTLNFFWLLLSYLMSQNPEASEPYMIEYTKIFALLAASGVLIQTIRQLWLLTIVAALALGYIALEVNLLYFSSGNISITRNGYGGLDNNGAGLMLAMGLPLCLFLWDGTKAWWRWVFLALVPIIAHAVMMTYSRGAMLSLIVTSPLLVIRPRRRLQVVAFATLFALLAVPLLAGPEIRNRFFSISDHDRDGSAQSRLGSWQAAWKIVQDYPVFGVGIRNANLFSYQYGADMEGRTIHSQYLQIAADNGFVGIGLYLTLLISVFADIRHARRALARRHDPVACEGYAVAAGAEASLATFCFGGIFLSLETFELPYLLILLGWKVAELTAKSKPMPSSPPSWSGR